MLETKFQEVKFMNIQLKNYEKSKFKSITTFFENLSKKIEELRSFEFKLLKSNKLRRFFKLSKVISENMNYLYSQCEKIELEIKKLL